LGQSVGDKRPTKAKGIMGNGGLRLRDWNSRCFSVTEGKSLNSIHAIRSFLLKHCKPQSGNPYQYQSAWSRTLLKFCGTILVKISHLLWQQRYFINMIQRKDRRYQKQIVSMIP